MIYLSVVYKCFVLYFCNCVITVLMYLILYILKYWRHVTNISRRIYITVIIFFIIQHYNIYLYTASDEGTWGRGTHHCNRRESSCCGHWGDALHVRAKGTLYRTVLNYNTHCDCELFSCSQKLVHLYNAWTWKMYLVN